MCRIPFLALNLFVLYCEKKDIFKNNRFEIYSEIINLINKNISEYSMFMMNIKKESFFQLANSIIVLEAKSINMQEVTKYLGKMTQIVPFSDKIEIEFYHLSFQEYFAAKYIINESNENNFWSNIDEYFSNVSIKNIFGVLDFIRDYSQQLFDKLLSNSSDLKKAYKLDDSLIRYLTHENVFKKLHFFSKESTDEIIFSSILEKQAILGEIYLRSDEIDHLSYLLSITQYCDYLEILEINFTINDMKDIDFIEILDYFLLKINERISTRMIKMNDCSIDFQKDFVVLETWKISYPKLKFERKKKLLTNYSTTSTEMFVILNNILKESCKIISASITSSTQIEYLERIVITSLNYLIVENFRPSLSDRIKLNNFLQNNKDLTDVILKDCNLDENWLNEMGNILKNLKNLKNIDFSNNNIRGIKFFKYLENGKDKLEKICFENCVLDSENIEDIKNVLQNFTKINSINFGDNQNLSFVMKELFYSLHLCKHILKNLCFYNCGLNECYMKEIENLLYNFNSIKEIDFGSNENLGSGIICVLRGLKNCRKSLEKLSFEHCGLSELNIEGIDIVLQNFNAIKHINLNFNKNLKSGVILVLNGLKECKISMQKMSFVCCGLNEKNIEGIEAKLKSFSVINYVDFSFNKNLGRGIIGVLNGMRFCKNSLKEIFFKTCGLKEYNTEGIESALKNFTSFKEVNFRGNKNLGLRCVEALRGLIQCAHSLQKVSFENCGLNEQTAAEIEIVLLNFTCLSFADFGSNVNLGPVCVKILSGLKRSKNSLQIVSFWGCGLNNNHVEHIKEELQHFSTLNYVNFGYNKNLGSGIKKILNGLKNCCNSLKNCYRL